MILNLQSKPVPSAWFGVAVIVPPVAPAAVLDSAGASVLDSDGNPVLDSGTP